MSITEERLTELQDAQTEAHRLKLLERLKSARQQLEIDLDRVERSKGKVAELEFIYETYYGPLPEGEV